MCRSYPSALHPSTNFRNVIQDAVHILQSVPKKSHFGDLGLILQLGRIWDFWWPGEGPNVFWDSFYWHLMVFWSVWLAKTFFCEHPSTRGPPRDLSRTSTPDPEGHAKSMKNQECMVTRIRGVDVLEMSREVPGSTGIHRKTFLQAIRTGKIINCHQKLSQNPLGTFPGPPEVSDPAQLPYMSREAPKGLFWAQFVIHPQIRGPNLSRRLPCYQQDQKARDRRRR